MVATSLSLASSLPLLSMYFLTPKNKPIAARKITMAINAVSKTPLSLAANRPFAAITFPFSGICFKTLSLLLTVVKNICSPVASAFVEAKMFIVFDSFGFKMNVFDLVYLKLGQVWQFINWVFAF